MISDCNVMCFTADCESVMWHVFGFFFSAGPSLGESEVKTETAYSLSQ